MPSSTLYYCFTPLQSLSAFSLLFKFNKRLQDTPLCASSSWSQQLVSTAVLNSPLNTLIQQLAVFFNYSWHSLCNQYQWSISASLSPQSMYAELPHSYLPIKRTHFVNLQATECVLLRARLYSTGNTSPKSVMVHARCSSASNPQGVRYPCLEDVIDGGAFQPHTHDIFICIHTSNHRSTLFHVFFKRHMSLSPNDQLGIHGDLVVMRVASTDVDSVVNLRLSDACIIDKALHRQ